jgi:hypothetical protein
MDRVGPYLLHTATRLNSTQFDPTHNGYTSLNLWSGWVFKFRVPHLGSRHRKQKHTHTHTPAHRDRAGGAGGLRKNKIKRKKEAERGLPKTGLA